MIDDIKEKAKMNSQTIVLPEAEDDRILRAAVKCVETGVSYPVLLGDPEEVREAARRLKVDIKGVEIVDHLKSPEIKRYISIYLEMRRDKKVSERMAERILSRKLYFGAMMLHVGDVDGMVVGAINLTTSVIRAGGLIVGFEEGVSTPSSFFIMDIPDFSGGVDGCLLFADCAVNVDPDAEQLADIAISSARSASLLFGWQPRVAMLSFSTKGSAAHPMVQKVSEATEIVRKRAPSLLVDGELQADAALIPSVARKKVKESGVAGSANILIFPDLNAGNIGYKLVQHVAGARAFGPILQGFAKPISDLSRGSTVDDVVGAIAVVAVKAQGMGR